jgi:hypothetical protein
VVPVVDGDLAGVGGIAEAADHGGLAVADLAASASSCKQNLTSFVIFIYFCLKFLPQIASSQSYMLYICIYQFSCKEQLKRTQFRVETFCANKV